jgi:hypothetical protein
VPRAREARERCRRSSGAGSSLRRSASHSLRQQMADMQLLSAKHSAALETNVQLAVKALNGHWASPHTPLVGTSAQLGSVEVTASSSFLSPTTQHARLFALSVAALVDPQGKFGDHSHEVPSSFSSRSPAQSSGSGFLQRLEDSVLRQYRDSAVTYTPILEEAPPPPSPAPVPGLSLSQRLLTSRSSRHTERVEAPATPPPPAAAAAAPHRQPTVKREPSFQQINKRVVSGLYIDSSLRSESPKKKSLLEQIQRSPQQALPVSPDHGPPHHALLSPPARPTRRPPPSPPVAAAAARSPQRLRTPHRGQEVTLEASPKSGGASRGPQYYRDLMGSGRERTPREPAESYHPETTTQSYLFSSPSFAHSPVGGRREERRPHSTRERSSG